MGVVFLLAHGAPTEAVEQPGHDALGVEEAGAAEVADVAEEAGGLGTKAAAVSGGVHGYLGAMRCWVASHSPTELRWTANCSPFL